MRWNPSGEWAGGCAIVTVLALACDPVAPDPPTKLAVADAEDAFEAAYCQRMFECDCESRIFASVDACMEAVREQLAALEPPPDIDNVAYDSFCMGEKVDEFDELGCATFSRVDQCERPCRLYHGEKGEGEPCRTLQGSPYSDCNKRLACEVTSCTGGSCDGFCFDPCRVAAEQSPCNVCDADEFCETTEDICVGLRALGDPCTSELQCESGFCPMGTCEAPPALGDACVSSLCGPGSRCDAATSTCVPTDAVLCSTPPEIR